MQKLGSNFIVRRSYYHRSKALDEIFWMARSRGVQDAKISLKVVNNTYVQIFSLGLELFEPNLD